jgi:hypothetical protein
MNCTIPSADERGSARAAAGDTWKDLVGAMPIVIFYRAVRELLRERAHQRAHRRAVLEAFRR